MADSPVAWDLLRVTAHSGKTPTQFRDERFDRLDAPPRTANKGVGKWPQDIVVMLYLYFLRTLS